MVFTNIVKSQSCISLKLPKQHRAQIRRFARFRCFARTKCTDELLLFKNILKVRIELFGDL